MGGGELAAGTTSSEHHPGGALLNILAGTAALLNGTAVLGNTLAPDAAAAYGGSHGLLGLKGVPASAVGGLMGASGGMGLGEGTIHNAEVLTGEHVDEGTRDATSWAGAGIGGIAGMLVPRIAPPLAAAGLTSHVTGSLAHSLEEGGHEGMADATATAGMGLSGALVGSIFGAPMAGAGLGLLSASTMGLLSDESMADEGVGWGNHRLTGREGGFTATSAFGGALVGGQFGGPLGALLGLGFGLGYGLGLSDEGPESHPTCEMTPEQMAGLMDRLEGAPNRSEIPPGMSDWEEPNSDLLEAYCEEPPPFCSVG